MSTFTQHFKLNRQFSLFEKFEFWLATTLYALAVTTIFAEGASEQGALFDIAYLKDILAMTILYLSFLILNYLVIPKIIQKQGVWFNIIVIAVIIAVSFALLPVFDRNYILGTLLTYFIIKYSFLFLRKKLMTFRDEKGSFYTGILLVTIFYLLLIILLNVGGAHPIFIGIPGILIPFAILLYIYSYQKLIPTVIMKKNPFRRFLWKVFLILFVFAVPLGILGYVILQDEEIPFVLNFVNVCFQYLVTVPLAWFTWKRHMRGKEEITTLQKELGQSTAKFDFLRSQINPHFLFNALNTLYGTAIMEKADRTGEGIQKLGDMMRFMLHENMQEKISLAREIEYLRNYIDLQKLRTDSSPNMIITADIQETEDFSQISPMLLIPFVENAFKHGVSFREPTHIKIALEKRGTILNFDVYNSKHQRPENDPEKDISGIGLTNVRQRLQLLYPEKHELVIRETGKEYFVHLTLDLSPSLSNTMQ